ncbi:prolipoprotein diacylglyceryl transferase family protein, partial [Klebsiella pneumoniae]
MLVHPQFDPIAVRLGPLAVHWYGITYLVAFGLFLWLAGRRARMPQHVAVGWTKQDVDDVLFYGVL